MKKAILISILMLGFAVITYATDIKIHTYLVSEVSAECVEVLIVVTKIDSDGTEYVISTGKTNLGGRCADQDVKTDKSSPNDLKETMEANPVIQRKLDDWYDEYVKKQAQKE